MSEQFDDSKSTREFLEKQAILTGNKEMEEYLKQLKTTVQAGMPIGYSFRKLVEMILYLDDRVTKLQNHVDFLSADRAGQIGG